MEPAVLTNYLSANKLSKAALAFKLGKQRSWLTNLFKESQARLLAYLRLAHYAGVSGLELAELIENQIIAELLDSLRMSDQGEFLTIADLSKEIGISQSFIKQLYKDQGSLNGIKSYVELAREIACELEELCTGKDFEELSA